MLDRELADILGIIRGIRDPESHPFGLIMLHHNFIRPHTGLGGKSPVAGITIEGPPWMTPIENAALRKAAMAAWRRGLDDIIPAHISALRQMPPPPTRS